MCFVLDNYVFSFEDQEHARNESCSMPFSAPQNLALYEDEHSVCVEVALPGLKKEEIKATFLKGELVIQGSQNEEEDANRKYHYKANRKYAYQLAIPGDIDETCDLDAKLSHGILKITFAKKKKAEAKCIPIQSIA